MSTLNDAEKRYLEKILNMSSGFVLDYTDATFHDFFRRHNIDIHGRRYQTYGTSKAKKMRAFWNHEPDVVVGSVLAEMLDSYEVACKLSGNQVDTPVLDNARRIVDRLTGKSGKIKTVETSEAFLNQEFTIPNIQKLPIEPAIVPIIESRLAEARKALTADAYLSGRDTMREYP